MKAKLIEANKKLRNIDNEGNLKGSLTTLGIVMGRFYANATIANKTYEREVLHILFNTFIVMIF